VDYTSLPQFPASTNRGRLPQRRLWPMRWSVWTAVACLEVCGAVAALYVLALWDGHPHRLGIIPNAGLVVTEPAFDAAFGCRGKLLAGRRAPGVTYTVEWSDDWGYKRVTFGPDGRGTQIEGGPFFGPGSMHILTPYEQFLHFLRRMGFDVR
jgi:hypothetical protein